MAVVAGIDEAGYGPLVGPLTVSAAAFRLPEEQVDTSLWSLLKHAVTKSTPKSRRIHVNDSKLVYKPALGVVSLEQHILPFLGMLGPLPPTVRDLAAQLGCENACRLDRYPWYVGRNPALPAASVSEQMQEQSLWLGEKLKVAGVAFCGARTEILDAGEFNSEMRRDDCKAVPLARRVAVITKYLWDSFGQEGLYLVIDKQGGRNFYGTFLRAIFEDCHLEAIEETANCSEYRVWDDAGRRATIIFEPRADMNYLPVALGSMISKYVRELFVEMINAYWIARMPQLKRTAGYFGDGRRFVKDVTELCRADGIALDLLLRCR